MFSFAIVCFHAFAIHQRTVLEIQWVGSNHLVNAREQISEITSDRYARYAETTLLYTDHIYAFVLTNSASTLYVTVKQERVYLILYVTSNDFFLSQFCKRSY